MGTLLIVMIYFCALDPVVGFSQSQEVIDTLLKNLELNPNSRNLSSSVEGARLISYGKAALPFLSLHFVDSTISPVYSDCNKVALRKGEIAIIIADRVETMPYALLTGVQNCTLNFCEDNPNLVEYYISFIRAMGADEFQTRYDSWLRRSDRKRMR